MVSQTIEKATWFSPRPPYSSGTVRPRKPCSPSSSRLRRGNRSSSSERFAFARISFSQSSMIVSRSSFWWSVSTQSGSHSYPSPQNGSPPHVFSAIVVSFPFSTCSVRGRLPALQHGRMPVCPNRRGAGGPGTELRLRELRVLLLQADPVRVARLQVLHEHLPGELVLAALGDREVDLEERVRVAVEDGRDAVLDEQRDVLEPVDVLARGRRDEVDVVEQRDVLLIGEPLPRENLGVDRARGLAQSSALTSSVGASGR